MSLTERVTCPETDERMFLYFHRSLPRGAQYERFRYCPNIVRVNLGLEENLVRDEGFMRRNDRSVHIILPQSAIRAPNHQPPGDTGPASDDRYARIPDIVIEVFAGWGGGTWGRVSGRCWRHTLYRWRCRDKRTRALRSLVSIISLKPGLS